jgi:argininosuccinate synthase
LTAWNGLIGELPPGDAAAIAAPAGNERESQALDRAAIESGAD